MSVIIIGSAKNEWSQTVLKEARAFLNARFPKARILVLVGTTPHITLTLPSRLAAYRTIWLIDDEGVRALRALAVLAHGIIAPNQSLEAAYLRLGISSKKIHVAYPPVTQESGEKRGETVTIACDGSIETEEGLGIFLRSAALSRDILGDIRLVIGGEPNDAKRLVWLVKTMGLSNITQIIPTPRSEWLARAHIYVLPSVARRIGGPLSLARALAAGCAIVATDQLSHREFIEPNKTGVLVPVGNAEAISQAIINLARNSAWMQSLGENASEFAREHFSRERFEQTLAALF